MIEVRGVRIADAELRWRFSRSGGPGGQNVNRRDTRAEVSFDLASTMSIGPVRKRRALDRLSHRLVDGVLTISSSEHRTQARNRQAALDRLVEILDEALAPPPKARKPTRPSKAARQRRLDDKRKRGEVKRGRRDPGFD